MRWLLGKQDGVEFLPTDWASHWSETWEAEFNDPEVLYGGFLWPDLGDLEPDITRLHERLKSDFAVGWSAVAFPVREHELGPFEPPTTARPHERAPFGLYLLSGQRLLVSLIRAFPAKENLEFAVHRQQSELGLTFCDPELELKLPQSEHRDFHFRARSKWSVLMSAGKALFIR